MTPHPMSLTKKFNPKRNLSGFSLFYPEGRRRFDSIGDKLHGPAQLHFDLLVKPGGTYGCKL
jgi:hypothetical protein